MNSSGAGRTSASQTSKHSPIFPHTHQSPGRDGAANEQLLNPPCFLHRVPRGDAPSDVVVKEGRINTL